jgi:molybdopterin converting factor small subunit
MSVSVILPGYLQPFANDQSTVELTGKVATVGEALDMLATLYPGVVGRVRTEQGEVREHVNVFVEGESIRNRGGLQTLIRNGGEILIIPAVSGG